MKKILIVEDQADIRKLLRMTLESGAYEVMEVPTADEAWAVAQSRQGPNVGYLSIKSGERYCGWRGAVAALAGMLTFPLILVLAVAVVYAQFASQPAVAGALRGMGAVAAGLIAGMGLKLSSTLRKHPLGLAVCVGLVALTVIAMAVLRWPLFWTLPSVGLLACVLTWRKIAP